MTKSKQHHVPTTNFVINLDKIDPIALQEKYQLFTIEVPSQFKFVKINNKYACLHNAYKEQLEYPYYFHTYAKPEATIYILVEKSQLPKSPLTLNLDFLTNRLLQAAVADISQFCNKEGLPVLVKLLLSSWYHKAHRTCQGAYFCMHSKDDRQKVTALYIDKIQAAKKMGEFEIISKAQYLKRLDEKFNTQYLHYYNYFEEIQGTRYLRQLKQSEVRKIVQSKKSLSNILRETNSQDTKNLNFRPRNPSIKWYQSKNFENCRSELLRNFQNDLVNYYNKVLGDGVAQKQSHFMTSLVPMRQPGDHTAKTLPVEGYGFDEKTYKGTGLYLKILGEVGVLDLRQKDVANPNQNRFQDYIDLLNKYYGKRYEISFSEIKREALAETDKAILVLQDVEKDIFDPEKEGFLVHCDDQKPILYQDFAKHIPMQTLNINLNKADDFDSETSYFNYTVFEVEDYKHRLDVCLNELLLKKYIINKLPILNPDQPNHCLPCVLSLKSLTQLAYMYGNIFMHIDETFVLQFLNLDNPSEKQKRNKILQDWNIDWLELDKQFAERNYTRLSNGQSKIYKKNGETRDTHEEKLKNTHFIFTEGLALAIEDTEERVLFKTEATEKKPSQRIIESKTALEGIYFSEVDSIYTVGEKSMNTSMDKSIKVRKLYYYKKPVGFRIDDLLQTLSVQFVRNKRYTVYPYFFDLLNLYRKDIQQLG